MKIQIDLPEQILIQLQFMADRDHRSRKNFIENLLVKEATLYEPKNPRWPKPKKP